jgi:tetratricopeptide (TPR) repeat protein
MFQIRKSITDMDVPAHRLARLAGTADSLKQLKPAIGDKKIKSNRTVVSICPPLPDSSVIEQHTEAARSAVSRSYAECLHLQEPAATTYLANALFKRQEYAEAELVYRRLVASTLDDQSKLASHLTGLAGALVAQNKLNEARDVMRKAVHAIIRSGHARMKTVARYLNLLADIYVKEHRYRAAELLFEQTLSLRLKYLPWDNENLVDVLRDYALMLRTLNRFHEAEKLEIRAFTTRLNQRQY